MMEYGGYGNTRFNRVAFTPGPKPQEATEERLISTCDATHSTNMRIGIQVTNSLFEKMTDDATNVNGTYGGAQTFNTVTKELVYAPGPKSFISINADFEPGDIVYIYTSTGKLLCQTTAASSSTNIGGGNKRVTLAQDANFEIIAGVTLVVNASANGGGFLYDNCLVQNNRSRGFLIKAPNGKITNCTLRSNGMSAILVKPEISDNWGECSFAQNLEITNNIIEGSGYFTGSELHSPINIAADSTPTDNPLYQNHKNITISGNVFRGRYTSYAITASGVDGLSITNNTFEGRVREFAEFTTPLINPIGPLDDTVPPIKLSGVQNVIVAGNIYPQSTELKVFVDESVKNLYGDDVTEYNSDKIAFILRPVFIGDSWKLQLQISNKTALPVSGEARISMPSTLGYATTVGFSDLAAGATVTKYLSVLVENPLAVPVIISYSLSDGTNGIASATISFLSAVNTENSQISIDGAVNDGEWQLTSTILLNNQQAAEKLSQWKGSNDTSARLKFRWDNEYLYVLADVQDDVHAQSNTNAADLWNGDSVQISIDSGRHNEVAGAHGYAELGFALGNDGKMYAHMWNNTITGADTQFDNTLQYAIIRNELDQKTIYEIAIPWKNIGLNQNPPTFGDTIGIAVIVNEDDGNGRRGYLRMFDGIGSGKHPELFGVMQMQGIYSENSVKTELVALISMAENINKKNYSEVSWNLLQIQLFKARQINALNYATADEISYAIDNLARAMDDLVKQSNKNALENLITRTEKLCSADYTPKSWEAFANTLASAMQVVNNIHSSETELKQAFMNLKQAFANLIKVNNQQHHPSAAKDKQSAEALKFLL